MAKWERDRACTPPWNIPTTTASTQKWAWLLMNMAKMAMPQ